MNYRNLHSKWSLTFNVVASIFAWYDYCILLHFTVYQMTIRHISMHFLTMMHTFCSFFKTLILDFLCFGPMVLIKSLSLNVHMADWNSPYSSKLVISCIIYFSGHFAEVFVLCFYDVSFSPFFLIYSIRPPSLRIHNVILC